MGMATPFLLTGVTGGLGAKILEVMLHVHQVPASSIIATSRSEARRSQFEAQGLQFRVADYKDRRTLELAFASVEDLLFVSSPEPNNDARRQEHANVIAAAKTSKVGKIWYVSLAFGGFDDTSKVSFQQAHYETENQLRSAGVNFISLRAGIYADAFPLFLNWYPSTTTVRFPIITPSVTQGQIAFTTRCELGEAIGSLLAKGLAAYPSIKPKTDSNIILLTANKTVTLVDLVGAINRARGTQVPVEYVDAQDLISIEERDDEGKKSKAWFEAKLVFQSGVASGDLREVDPALATILGRQPEDGVHAVERLLRANPDYTWHQNYSKR